LTAFLATRPLSNVAFVIAKVRTAGWAAVVCWVLVLLITLGWLVLTGGWRDLPPAWEQLAGRFGPAQAAGLVAALALGPVLLIWRIFVVNFWAALTGRSWIGVAQAIVTGILFLQFGYEWVQWNIDPVRRERILGILPWVAVAAIGFKLTLAAVVIRVLHRRGDLSSGAVFRLLAAWCVAVIGLFAVLAAVCPAGRVSLFDLVLGTVLFVPLARPALAPLALAWNRHR
jgi:hypothetical protein